MGDRNCKFPSLFIRPVKKPVSQTLPINYCTHCNHAATLPYLAVSGKLEALRDRSAVTGQNGKIPCMEYVWKTSGKRLATNLSQAGTVQPSRVRTSRRTQRPR